MPYRVYVIQLRDSYGKRDHSHLPALYVGQSHYTPEDRLGQHARGYWTGSRYAGKHIWRLRPELYEDLPPVYERFLAEGLERDRALRLAEAGFTVRSDGVIPKVPLRDLRPFDASELVAVEDLFDRMVFSVVARRLRPQRIDDVVAILRGERGAPLNALVVTPCAELGRFAHVERPAVRDRIVTMVLSRWLFERDGGLLDLPSHRPRD